MHICYYREWPRTNNHRILSVTFRHPTHKSLSHVTLCIDFASFPGTRGWRSSWSDSATHCSIHKVPIPSSTSHALNSAPIVRRSGAKQCTGTRWPGSSPSSYDLDACACFVVGVHRVLSPPLSACTCVCVCVSAGLPRGRAHPLPCGAPRHERRVLDPDCLRTTRYTPRLSLSLPLAPSLSPPYHR